MAKRRMFSKDVIDTDHFLEMPMSSQLLYFHLALRADDDGFVSSPKRILRLIGSSDDDFKLLLAKDFIIPFESGICVIKHWRIHNYIRNDRYNETIYQDEKKLLVEENNVYSLKDLDKKKSLGIPDDIPNDIPNGYTGKDRLVKDRIVKDSKDCTEDSQESIGTPFIKLPCIGNPSDPKSVHIVTEEDISNYKDVYPAVDVKSELKKMKLWLDAHPANRKKNVKVFIARWLARSQDRPQMQRKKTEEELRQEYREQFGGGR
jgi:hypothetical protein